MTRRTTIVEVAELAGVSISSVSRVLNGIPARKGTEEKVRSAAAQLGYTPDATGRALKLGSSLQVAFAVDDIGNPVYTEMMQGVEEGMSGSGARLVVASTGHDKHDLLSLVQSLSRGYADALVISPLQRTPELVQALLDAPVPVVVIGDLGPDVPLDVVRTDSRRGVVLAHEHLVASGRRRIAFVNGPTDTSPGRARLEGFQTAVATSGAAGPVIQASGFTVTAGEEAWAQLEALGPRHRPDAVLAANDLLALGVMRAALNAGRRLPRQLGVVGIDDIQFARIFSPSLTSVSLQARERGRLAAELLLERIATPGTPARTRFVAPELVVRESSRSATDAALGQSS
ncbi:transcriptional regulator, LacI family [Pedococcus dokdonensis]|uniref:Transcriptional regulator, LacI family n=1 Tax=Pedococcus dokdonensis TaxID=443156 RepID=A0A1H0TWT3_9MICO|nr:LacI family DNA-binding transcriptional regulator [Pedococcus dokdonensis]SDP58414.1 transcriptional regulator, LacI family [Pedococcus dokdonensis]